MVSDLLRHGSSARLLAEAAISTEYEDPLSGLAHENSPDRRQRVVRNHRHSPRKILTGLGEPGTRVPNACGRMRSAAPIVPIEGIGVHSAPSEPLDVAMLRLKMHQARTDPMGRTITPPVGRADTKIDNGTGKTP